MDSRLIPALSVLAAAAAPAAGQSLNIDFGDEHGNPPASYAAAGLPGTWNVLTGTLETPAALVGLNGQPIAATIRLENAFGTLADVPLPHPEVGEHLALLGEGILGAFGPKVPVNVSFEGLASGRYRLITYTWYAPADQFAESVFVDGSPIIHPVGGPWPGGLVTGVTHMVHVVQVTDGTLDFFVVGDGPGSFFNGDILIQGLQLWKIDEPIPCPADLDGDGSVAVTDLLAMLAAWGPCASCPADLDGDGSVGVIDLLALLAAWGPCPGTTPASCGSAGLGDCYLAHPSPGCSEPACCQSICAADPYCCNVAWDALCAGSADLDPACAAGVHPNCGGPRAHSCFETGLQGCDDPACCNDVCDFDPFCCNYGWDGQCVAEALLFCSKIPEGCGHPAAGDCFDAIGKGQNLTPWCDDKLCCNTVCAFDPFCCEVLWDQVCVAEANASCEGGACGKGAGSCFEIHLDGSGGCDDPACCQQVCALVPICCEDFDPGVGDGGWDQFCVQWAQKLCEPTQ